MPSTRAFLFDITQTFCYLIRRIRLMNFRHLLPILLATAACAGWPQRLPAQDPPQFTNIQRLPNNREIVVSFSAPTGSNYRIETSEALPFWNALVTLPASSASSLQHTDSAAPYLPTRVYRALQLPGEATNAVRAFRPGVVYPYHYRDSSGAISNAAYFKQLLGTNPAIEVRLRKWY